eukprot:TRINITY_DN1062_c0_g1_i1.p1 TRINITY_DN1062_c0_g1~~TRINITY_DN1062_c0_g1_i1.p1  ORF type:complete len:884 (+),score=292.47 TRINITY_DN1062_c0_g1_i1:99-2750(+)
MMFSVQKGKTEPSKEDFAIPTPKGLQSRGQTHKRRVESPVSFPTNVEKSQVDEHGDKKPGASSFVARIDDDPFDIRIPIQRGERLSAADDPTLAHEYAVKFLEKIGANPTPSNIRFVSDRLHLDDMIVVDVLEPTMGAATSQFATREPAKYVRLVPRSVIPPKTLVPSSLDDKQKTYMFEGRGDPVTVPETQSVGYDPREARLTEWEEKEAKFEEYRQKFLFPQNLSRSAAPLSPRSLERIGRQQMEREKEKEKEKERGREGETGKRSGLDRRRDAPSPTRTVSMEVDSSSRAELLGDASSSSESPSSSFLTVSQEKRMKSRSVGEDKKLSFGASSSSFLHPLSEVGSDASQRSRSRSMAQTISMSEGAKVALETQAPPAIGIAEIMDLQRNFFRVFPFHRISQDAIPIMEHIRDKLTSPLVCEFIRALSFFLHETFFVEQRSDNYWDNFIHVYGRMLALLHESRKGGRQKVTYELPLLVLSIRIAIDRLFRMTYPLWSQTKRPNAILPRMDVVITLLMDPMYYSSSIPSMGPPVDYGSRAPGGRGKGEFDVSGRGDGQQKVLSDSSMSGFAFTGKRGLAGIGTMVGSSSPLLSFLLGRSGLQHGSSHLEKLSKTSDPKKRRTSAPPVQKRATKVGEKKKAGVPLRKKCGAPSYGGRESEAEQDRLRMLRDEVRASENLDSDDGDYTSIETLLLQHGDSSKVHDRDGVDEDGEPRDAESFMRLMQPRTTVDVVQETGRMVFGSLPSKVRSRLLNVISKHFSSRSTHAVAKEHYRHVERMKTQQKRDVESRLKKYRDVESSTLSRTGFSRSSAGKSGRLPSRARSGKRGSTMTRIDIEREFVEVEKMVQIWTKEYMERKKEDRIGRNVDDSDFQMLSKIDEEEE